MDEDGQLPEEQPDQSEDQNSSQEPNLKDLKNAKSDFSKLAKSGAKSPAASAAGGTATTTEAGALAGGATSGAATSTAAAGSGAAAGGAASGAAAASAPAWPWILLIAIIVFLLFLLFLLIVGILSDGQHYSTPVQITKSGPEEVPNDTNINYSLSVTYSGMAEDIIIKDPIPSGTEFVSTVPSAKMLDANGAATTDPTLTKAVEWSLKEITGTTGQALFSTQTLTLTVRPLSDDIYVINQATASVIGGIGNPDITPIDGGFIPPSTDNCGGYYNLSANPLNANFGDPNCTMTTSEDKNNLYNYINSRDSNDIYLWFTIIIPQESGFNPNAFNGNAVDECGAWGLFQMNKASCVTHSAKPEEESFLQYKHGDINWEMQTNNAINYGNEYRKWFEQTYQTVCPNAKWRYWEAAKDYWDCGTPWP